MKKRLLQLSPTRTIALGFAGLIILGSFLLMLPHSVRKGVDLSYINALYTSTSAVCVTGLIVVDAKDTFTPFGQCILAILIQMGGLGVTCVGAGIMLAVGKKLGLRGRVLIRESFNIDTGRGIVRFIYKVFQVTALFEIVGAALCFLSFQKDFPMKQAMGISLFHSIAAFNNSGFDVMGNYQNLIPYQNHYWLNIITCVLIFFGGIGFFVIREIWDRKFCFKKLSMHAKVVLSVSVILIIVGTLMLKLTEDITWLSAFFHSVSARTAGFCTNDIGSFTNAGLLVLIVLMFIGASPGSTGGGVKTSTIFVILQGLKASATNQREKAFHYSIPSNAFKKAYVIFLMALMVVTSATFLMCIFEPSTDFLAILFEVISALGTVGLSTGITKDLGMDSKILSIIVMYIGRLGPLTVATLWHFSKRESVRYPEGNILIG